MLLELPGLRRIQVALLTELANEKALSASERAKLVESNTSSVLEITARTVGLTKNKTDVLHSSDARANILAAKKTEKRLFRDDGNWGFKRLFC